MDLIRLFKVLMAPEVAMAVEQVIASGTVTEGPRVENFERRLADALGADRPLITLNSCTSAIELALHLVGVGPGDEVIATPMSCAASYVGAVRRGVEIVWADVDPATGLILPEDVARKTTSKTKAVIAVDWAGRVCDYASLWDIVIPTAATVIEDAAHAFGAHYRGVPVARDGGEYVCWSFQAIKHLSTCDGGALRVPRALDERARKLRWFGIDRRSPGPNFEKLIEEPGYKLHMNDLNAAIGLANLAAAVAAVEQHRANAAWYGEALKDLDGVTLPPVDPGSAWWLYTILLDKADQQQAFMQHMRERGVETSLVHMRCDNHPALRGRDGFVAGALPGVDYYASREVAIPVGWWLMPSDRERVADAVKAWVKR